MSERLTIRIYLGLTNLRSYGTMNSDQGMSLLAQAVGKEGRDWQLEPTRIRQSQVRSH